MESPSVQRLARLRAKMDAEGIRAFFIRDTSNIAWLTAFDDVFDEEDAHAVLFTPHLTTLHTDSRYSASCRRCAEGGPFTVDDTPANHEAWLAGIFQNMHGAQADASSIRLAIESSMMLGEYRLMQKSFQKGSAQPELVETRGFVRGLRAVKDAAEIERLRAAQAVTDAAFTHIVGFMKPGMTEEQVQIELEDFMRRHGARDLAFPSIVATGPNAASAHATPGDTPLQAGQCVVMDFGARRAGYCSDMTRTVFIGEPDARLRDAYACVREANERAAAAIAPGVVASDVHGIAESVLEQGGYAGKMGHALGHGVGIDIHEDPVLAPRNDEALVAGNVVTVEPGIYLEGDFGMRLEDFGVVTDDGFDVFTQSTHDMVVV